MNKRQRLTFLKVLSIVAWADGEATQAELNLLKTFFQKFSLEDKEFNELKTFMEAPTPPEMRDALVKELTRKFSSQEDREELLAALKEMAEADGVVDEAEASLLESIRAQVEGKSESPETLKTISSMFKQFFAAAGGDSGRDLEQYFKRQLYQKLELKMTGRNVVIDWKDERFYLVCLLGALIASAAHVDGSFDDSEKKVLRSLFKEKLSFAEGELDIFLDVVDEQAKDGFDFYEVVTEVNRLVSMDDRIKLMDCFFEVACADGELAHEETEEIRRITKAMLVPHADFIETKMKFLTRLREQ
ncbi:MAG: hypothetical protein G3M78_14940 [Candidatus Nitrohelix vancouverensis]|uniref:Co-chaperone DjlA N-terminal domain-containing protein n=1 Tax=Candidatus Nitrohelix vancouverensis TaxID=2705534 RepID=A0A7T0C503_9BACT|nr:MAG: hypothetical protein G3M78_14940 [Candidatus Nitrohelix vancouverensis]